MAEEKNAVSVQSFSVSMVMINNSQFLLVTCLYGLPTVLKFNTIHLRGKKRESTD